MTANMYRHCAADGWRERILSKKRRALHQRVAGITTPSTRAQVSQDNSKTKAKFEIMADLHIQRIISMTFTAEFLGRLVLKCQFVFRERHTRGL